MCIMTQIAEQVYIFFLTLDILIVLRYFVLQFLQAGIFRGNADEKNYQRRYGSIHQ